MWVFGDHNTVTPSGHADVRGGVELAGSDAVVEGAVVEGVTVTADVVRGANAAADCTAGEEEGEGDVRGAREVSGEATVRADERGAG